jgi:hypothetical protein
LRLADQLADLVEPVLSGVGTLSSDPGSIALCMSKKERAEESQVFGVKGAVDEDVRLKVFLWNNNSTAAHLLSCGRKGSFP